MRDEMDPGTIEMKLPKKRGRPSIGAAPMTDAERARAYRERRKDERFGDVAAMTDTALLDSLRAAITAGNAELAGVYVRHLGKRYPYV